MDPSPLPTFTINGFVADLGSETLHDRKGNALALRPQAFMVLRHLLLNSGRLVTKDELIETVWPATAVTDDSIVQCIHEIRRALNDDAHAVLKTVPRRGYRLVLPTNAAIGLPRRSLVAASIVGVLMIIAGAAASWWLLGSPSTPIGKPVVAVLPFDNYGDSEATGRLADGLAEDIITDLARFPEFQVIARHSTQIYAGRSITSAEIGKALGVSFLVQGSILRRAGRLRITAQLLDAATGKHLWSDRWDRPHEDLFAIQTEISEQVSNRLGGGSGVIEEAGRIRPIASRQATSLLTSCTCSARKSLRRSTAPMSRRPSSSSNAPLNSTRGSRAPGSSSITHMASCPVSAPISRPTSDWPPRLPNGRSCSIRATPRRTPFWALVLATGTILHAPRWSSIRRCAWRRTSSKF
ncbi:MULTISPECIES: winged helix-turn-helix domain-containing protein [unclassified Mesorhizobium]|uniref:winged helix-turn-helix domain-containing protein n=1 Tax=unclassified Mesorhizobium TaxID=325217 RepID=UPI000F750060|nr:MULTISPECIES: winged helix-turn-helix domain-containing protein [unclassified Mesorhizobium]AZO05022.1 hypothetical protein EJ068_19480 [Mesorhizobium sp. M2A.F.Ca.ET.043.02.1.1]RWB37567.1 MAG: hypothetical protein EOQ46_31635 [Mesorhizobium sp.]RWB54046.1 MAG: hypothetical protein EOQ48_32705 [Mesorhizobium sp.]RWB80036.1 MAG: hypothetical protein EOQ51_31620 [Mesorhizobium sp.]RWD70079.1 MAG: hypothetical protein EOS60_20615 [Mesorhizobium sp.]